MSAAERREQLLDVTLQILCEQGSEALSIDAIARGAGITRPVVYTQFGDLAGLLTALFEREERHVLTQLAKAIPMQVGEIDPDEVILGAIETFFAAVHERPYTWQIILTPPQGVPRALHDKVVERREAVIEQITPLIAWGVTKRGGPMGLDHRLLARIILVIAEEGGRLVVTQPDLYPVELLVQQAKVLVASLAVNDPSHAAAAPAFAAHAEEQAQALAAEQAAAAAAAAEVPAEKPKRATKPRAKKPAAPASE
ncbi:MAG: TetR/AcrR family transcriptional regulator [Solirubrobacteraceae bacterium]|nr:TetR/AcrR family transcriptional regulator [Solirubrobacteraceae bacterium]